MIETGEFREQGYQVFRNILGRPTVVGVRSFLQAQVDRQLRAASREIGSASPSDLVAHISGITAAGAKAIGMLSKDTRDTLSGHFDLEARLSPELLAIPRQSGLRNVLEAVLGTDRLFMHMPPTARFVIPGNVYAGVPPHQDISYNKHMTDFVTVWVPLVDIDDDCGGVKVYRGSGAAKERLANGEEDKFWLKGLSSDGYDGEHCKISVGDVLLLSRWIIHESMPNRSNRTRFSIDYRFFSARDSSTKHYLDMQHWTVVAPAETAQR